MPTDGLSSKKILEKYSTKKAFMVAFKQGVKIEGKGILPWLTAHKASIDGVAINIWMKENQVLLQGDAVPKAKVPKSKELEALAVESTLKDTASRRMEDFKSAGKTEHQGVNAGGDYVDKSTGELSHHKGGKKDPGKHEFQRSAEIERQKRSQLGIVTHLEDVKGNLKRERGDLELARSDLEQKPSKLEKENVQLREDISKLLFNLEKDLDEQILGKFPNKKNIAAAIKKYRETGEKEALQDKKELWVLNRAIEVRENPSKHNASIKAKKEILEANEKALEGNEANVNANKSALKANEEARRQNEEALAAAQFKLKQIEEAPDESQQHLDTYKELVYGGLYNRILPGQSPKIGLRVDDAELSTKDLRVRALSDKSEEVVIRSKFFENYQSLADDSRGEGEEKRLKGYWHNEAAELSKLEGFEKVMGACLCLGEIDYHANNLGVVRKEGGRFEVVKIDHGRSGSYGYSEERAENEGHNGDFPAAGQIATSINRFAYKKIPFDLGKFKASLDEMVPVLRAEAQDFIDKSMHQLDSLGVDRVDGYERPAISRECLQKMGVEISEEQYNEIAGFELQYDLYTDKDGEEHYNEYFEPPNSKDWQKRINFPALQKAGIDISPEQYDKALQHTKSRHVGRMEQRLSDVETLSKHMDIFCKMEPKIPGYEFFVDLVYQTPDPILYAIETGKKIDGKEPVLYAIEQGKKLDGKDPVLWAFEQKPQVKIDGQYPLRYAEMKDYKINVEEGKELTATEFAEANNAIIPPQIKSKPSKELIAKVQGLGADARAKSAPTKAPDAQRPKGRVIQG